VIMLFAFVSAFDHLFEFLSLFLFFFFFSHWLPNVCVVNALIKREIDSLCGLRTGGWSLPSVMSD
jgi:4-hydroxybenzoate polyprenyltransferase